MLETAIPLDRSRIRLFEGYLRLITADRLFARLLADVDWQQPEIKLFGRIMKSPRLAAWYGDKDAVYEYSGLVNYPKQWLPELQIIKTDLEGFLDTEFNSVLINLYRSGNDAMGWHSDDEPELGDCPVIASLSLGATRRFLFRHKVAKKRNGSTGLDLSHGSLLVMSGETQQFWQHGISRTKKTVGPRVNLTFRKIYPCDRNAGL